MCAQLSSAAENLIFESNEDVQAVEVDQAAWANLDDKDGGEEAGPADAPQDDLWQEFKSRDQVANDKVMPHRDSRVC